MSKKPDGEKILRTLIELLADQEGVIVKYRIVNGDKISELYTTGKKDYLKEEKIPHKRKAST